MKAILDNAPRLNTHTHTHKTEIHLLRKDTGTKVHSSGYISMVTRALSISSTYNSGAISRTARDSSKPIERLSAWSKSLLLLATKDTPFKFNPLETNYTYITSFQQINSREFPSSYFTATGKYACHPDEILRNSTNFQRSFNWRQ